MRVTFDAVHRHSTDGLEESASRLLEYQRQVSTGKRIEKPSDDPAAMAAAIGERSKIAALDRYGKAADSVASRLAVVDTVLSDLVSQLTAAQVAAASARGSSKTPVQREAAATDLEAVRDTIFSDLTASFNGAYLFSGSSSTVAPYTRTGGGAISPYAGSPVEMVVDVDEHRSLKVAFDGQAIAQGTDARDVFAEFDALIAAVRAGDDAAVGAGMDALRRMFDRVSTAQGRVGADLRTIGEQQLRLDEMRRSTTARLSSLEDADMADAITRMTQADAAYRAALGAATTVTRMSLMDYLR